MKNIKKVLAKVVGNIDLVEATEITEAIYSLVGEDTDMELECLESEGRDEDISINIVMKRNFS